VSVLTVDVGGANETTLQLQRGGHAAPRRVGGLTEGLAGSEESAVIAELMVVPFVTVPLDFATAKTVRDLFALGAQVNCAGDVFDKPGTIVCSADITDEVDPTARWFTLSGTLYECENDDTTYTPLSTIIYLTNQLSPDDPGDGSVNMASSNAADDPFSAGLGTITLLDGVTIDTTPAVTSSPAAEGVWLTKPTVLGGWASGSPTVQFLSQGGSATTWEFQDAMCKLFVVRGGVDVAEWDTAWSAGNGGLGGGAITMAAPAIVFLFQPGDQIRIEPYGRAAYKPAQSGGTLQDLIFGNNGGGAHEAKLVLGGSVSFQ
jgi:hypothetical protein